MALSMRNSYGCVFFASRGNARHYRARGGHFHIMELRIRVNKNVEKGSDFCHRASSTFLEIRGQFSTTSTLRVSILNNEHRHLGSYFGPSDAASDLPIFSELTVAILEWRVDCSDTY